MCEQVGCVENQREAAALLCALAVPHENKLPLAESGSAEPLMHMCQSIDVEVRAFLALVEGYYTSIGRRVIHSANTSFFL